MQAVARAQDRVGEELLGATAVEEDDLGGAGYRELGPYRVDVTHDEEVEEAVLVEVAPGGAHGPQV